jgi:hypothetical protein
MLIANETRPDATFSPQQTAQALLNRVARAPRPRATHLICAKLEFRQR